MENNYSEVKNFIHNDLKITKEYINNIIRETVKCEIRKSFKDTGFLNQVVKAQVKEILNTEYTNPKYKPLFELNELIYDKVCEEVCKTVSNNVKINVGINSDNVELFQFKESKIF